jgi:hypothetical protein
VKIQKKHLQMDQFNEHVNKETELSDNTLNGETSQASENSSEADNKHSKATVYPRVKPWTVNGAELITRPHKVIPTLWSPFLQKVGLAALAGSSDVGKSYLLLQLSISIINGSKTFLGYPLKPEHKKVLFISTEDTEDSLSFRLKNMDGIESKSFSSIDFAFDTHELVRYLEAYLSENKVDLVVIDTFADVYSGNINQTNEVRSFLQQYQELAIKHKCLILFNHHCGKRNDERIPSKENLLGSQGFESKMRVVMELRIDPSDIKLRHLCIVKGNYLDDTLKHKSLEMSFKFDEGFIATGKRVPFHELKRDNLTQKEDDGLIREVFMLKKQGKSCRQIAADLKTSGKKVGKSKVSEILKTMRPSTETTTKMDLDGQIENIHSEQMPDEMTDLKE